MRLASPPASTTPTVTGVEPIRSLSITVLECSSCTPAGGVVDLGDGTARRLTPRAATIA
jgi:hypothetical protein